MPTTKTAVRYGRAADGEDRAALLYCCCSLPITAVQQKRTARAEARSAI